MKEQREVEPTINDLRWFWKVLGELADESQVTRQELCKIMSDADKQVRIGGMCC
jgi:hypothetical protein